MHRRPQGRAELRIRRQTLLVLLVFGAARMGFAQSGAMSTMGGLNTVQFGKIGQTAAPDPTIAVGTLQVCEHVNSAYQCWWKSGPNAFQPVNFLGSTNPKLDGGIWSQNNYNGMNTPRCSANNTPNSQLLHDNVYNLWILEKRIHNTTTGHDYLCAAISNLEDVSQPSFGWFGFEFDLDTVIPTNTQGHYYFPDYPQSGLWQTSTTTVPPYLPGNDQAMWISYDLQDPDNHMNTAGVLICAIDLAGLRASTSTPWVNNSRTPACALPYPLTTFMQRDNWVPANNSDTTPPIASDGEMFTYVIEPPHDTRTFLTDPSHTQGVEQWTIDWTAATPVPTRVNNWDLPSTQAGGDQMACFNPRNYYNTVCIPQPSTASTGIYIDSLGDRMQQFFHYTSNGGLGGIWTSSRTIQITPSSTATSQSEADLRTLQWNSSVPPAVIVSTDYAVTDPNDPAAYVFLPSLARDKVGNLLGIFGVSGPGANEHPGLDSMYYIIAAATLGSYGYIADPSVDGDAKNTDPSNYRWGNWYGAVLDPVDSCTVWTVGEYLPADRTTPNYWYTQIAELPALDSCLTPPAVTLNPPNLLFSAQAIGSTSSERVVTLSNTGTVPLTINGLTASGNYGETDDCTGVIVLPSGNCTIRVTFSPTSIGTIAGAVTITDSASSSPQVIGVSGTGVTPLTTSPAVLSFGNVNVGTTSAVKTMTVVNNTGATVSLGLTGSGEYAVSGNGAAPCGSALGAGQQCTAGVTFSPLVNGTTRGGVTVTSNTAYSPQVVSLSGIGVNGGAGPLTFTPSNLVFNGVVAGTTTSAAKTVTVTNASTGTVTISGITVSGEYGLVTAKTTCGGALAGGGKCTIGVTFSPMVAGTVYGSVQITDDAAIGMQVVSLSSTSVWPVSVTPGSLSFGVQGVGTTSAAQVLTLTNNQGTALTLSSIVASGDYIVTTAGASPCGSSVAGKGQCTIGVEFSPSQAGTIAGAVTISHSAATSPLEVGVIGTGQ